jgi:type III restriction enzyme
MHDDGKPVQRSLFDFVDHQSCENNFERAIALCLDKDADVLWWYRNLVGDKHFHIQGYRKQKVFPDFLVHRTPVPRENHLVLVLEGKGDMRDVEDTEYKRNLAGLFSKAGKRVPWQKLGEEFRDHIFKFEILDESAPDGRDWKDTLREILR